MKAFEVTVIRQTLETKTMYVDAESVTEAVKLAEEKASEQKGWVQTAIVYDVENVNYVESPK